MRACSTWREQIDSLGVSVYEHAGVARFVDPHTIETTTGLRLQAENSSFAREESVGGSTSPDSSSHARQATPGA